MAADSLTTQPELGCNQPEVVFEELIEEIRYALINQPRNLQSRIGPSELGDPCDRALIAKLTELPEPEEPPNWRAWVGNAMHVGLADIFANSFLQQYAEGPRYLLEQEVTVGTIGGVEITGHCDLFDTVTGSVVDWKSKSMTQHQYHRKHGVGEKYQVQRHLYGLGMVNAGYHVNTVMCVFMRRDGELHDIYQLSEPYDESIALAALARANRLHALATLVGVETAMNLYPACTGRYCRVCKNFRAPFGAPKEVVTTLPGLLSGEPKGNAHV